MTPIWHDESHGLGWVPERAPERVLGRLRSVPWELTYADATSTEPKRAPWHISQGNRQSCTGFAIAGAVHQATGRKFSPWYWWQWAVARDGYIRTEGRIRDVGVRFSAIEGSCSEHGAVPYDDWSEATRNFEDLRIPPAMLRAEAQRVQLDVVTYHGAGQRMLDVIVDSLARGYGVTIATQVDRGFEKPNGGIVGPREGESAGGHMFHASHVKMRNGERVVTCINSWPHWNGDGTVDLSEARLRECPYTGIIRGVHLL
jgi:hypothetical protein